MAHGATSIDAARSGHRAPVGAVGESVAFAVLYISLGVDSSIHLCLRVSELRSHGLGVGAGLELAARDVGGSLLLAALTTSLGFFAFVPTPFTGVAELGIIAGCGVLLGLFANATVMPALLCLMWRRTTKFETEGLDPPGVVLLERAL